MATAEERIAVPEAGDMAVNGAGENGQGSMAQMVAEYRHRGLAVRRLDPRTKAVGKGTPVRHEDLIPDVFVRPEVASVGVDLGEASGDVVDCDLDCPEAIEMADGTLPDTGAVFGRKGKPKSHRLYVFSGLRRIEFHDGKGMLLELRGTGQGTVFPPSLHESGETIAWEAFGEPARLEGQDPLLPFRLLAMKALVARRLPQGGRHDFALALAGFLPRPGRLNEETVLEVMQDAWDCAGYASGKDRAEAMRDLETIVEDTEAKLEGGRPVQGGPTLEQMAPGVPAKIAEWFGWKGSAEQAREEVEALVGRVGETVDPDLVWDALDALAKVDAPVYQNAKRRLKARLGKDLNLNDLEREVGDARKRAKDGKPTDDELRDRWARRHPDDIAFGLGGWMRYGRRQPGVWSPAAEYEVERQVEELCVEAKPEGIRPTAALVASVESLARNRRAVDAELWDADPDILVCRNGALHVPTRELRPHDPAHRATHGVPYDYDPEAQAPMWGRFLDEIIVPVIGQEGAEFLQEFAGYALTTDVSHELALWLYGPPGGGRSTFIFAMEAMLGDKAGTLGLQEISTSQFALSGVPGKTLLTATEQPAGYMRASHVLNKLISGDRIRVEEKYKSPYDVYPKAKLLWAMNELPKVASSYDGLFRRVKVIRLPAIRKKDPKVKETIATEGAGILNWGLEGLVRLKERGRFEVPGTVRGATREWKESNDVAAMFVAERCDTGEDYRVGGETLYGTYSGWCRSNGFTPKNAKNAAEDWERLGFRKKRVKGRSYWHGVRITPVVMVDDLGAQEKAG